MTEAEVIAILGQPSLTEPAGKLSVKDAHGAAVEQTGRLLIYQGPDNTTLEILLDDTGKVKARSK
jgi:hypothetical protein